MPRSIKRSLLAGLLCLCLIPFAQAQPGRTSTLKIRILGASSDEGKVRVALFSATDDWLGEPAYKTTLTPRDGFCEWTLQGVPYGEYAAAAYHDENNNGENDRTFIGLPLEAYGFSNDVRARIGPPRWKNAKFLIDSPTREITFSLK